VAPRRSRGRACWCITLPDCCSRGVAEAELREDYPHLTLAMIEAARIYVQAHPRRGRPRKPAWRNARPVSQPACAEAQCVSAPRFLVDENLSVLPAGGQPTHEDTKPLISTTMGYGNRKIGTSSRS
jgi:hypothetical protein